MTSVAIVVVTFNSADSIEELMDSIPGAWASGSPAVVVVDNGSTDETVAIVMAKYPFAIVVEQANLGYSAGINAGIEAAPRGIDYFFILNPDATLHANCIDGLLEAFTEPAIGIVAPRVLGLDGHTELSLRREPSILRSIGLNFTGLPRFSEYVAYGPPYQGFYDPDWVLGAAMMISAQCAASVGSWDESFFLYSEETDYCLRARDEGWTIRYTPDALVTHQGGGSGRSARTHAMQVVNRVRLFARRHGLVATSAYWFANVASESSWILRGRAESRAGLISLCWPRARPRELNASDHLIPR